MEKHISGLLVVIAAIFLLVGGLVGYNIGETRIETVTVTETVYQNVSVTEYIDVTQPSELDRAVAEFLVAIEDEEVLNKSNNDSYADILGNYNFDELEVSKIYDDYTVSYYDDKTTIDFKIRLRFDEDNSRAVKETFNVTVIFEEDEDTEVLIA